MSVSHRDLWPCQSDIVAMSDWRPRGRFTSTMKGEELVVEHAGGGGYCPRHTDHGIAFPTTSSFMNPRTVRAPSPIKDASR